jgi:hypothetical protein
VNIPGFLSQTDWSQRSAKQLCEGVRSFSLVNQAIVPAIKPMRCKGGDPNAALALGFSLHLLVKARE